MLEPAEVADAVRSERARRNWTQEKLAKKAGVSAWTVSTIEDGKARPRIETLRKVFAALELTLTLSRRPSRSSAA